MKESSWRGLVELARSLGTGIRLHGDMKRQSYGDVFTQICHIYFNSPSVYRDEKCLSLPFWKRHAYKDRAYSEAVCEAFRLFCRAEVEKVRNSMMAGTCLFIAIPPGCDAFPGHMNN